MHGVAESHGDVFVSFVKDKGLRVVQYDQKKVIPQEIDRERAGDVT